MHGTPPVDIDTTLRPRRIGARPEEDPPVIVEWRQGAPCVQRLRVTQDAGSYDVMVEFDDTVATDFDVELDRNRVYITVKSLALEGASRNITANAIAPSCTDTAMVSAVRPEVMEQILKAVPAGRLGTPAEVARGVVFLAADDAGFINGITLSINGGKYLA
jgi:hypothetical protein